MSTPGLHIKKRWWHKTRAYYLPYAIVVALLALFRPLPVKAQNISANLDQGSNDKSTSPLSPVKWVNGNLNENSAHFREGHSVPYRAILKGLTVNQTYTLVIAYDVKHGGKQALDYLTHFQRLDPHALFGHAAETVNPKLDIAGFSEAYFTTTDTYPIPPPSSAGSPVAGMPTASFNALPGAEKVITGYNADITAMTYVSNGDLNAAQDETVMNVTFKALKETVVLSWGGHIASVEDWGIDPANGEPFSATGISGSPYHMRLKEWIVDGEVISIGNQDRSLKTAAVSAPPEVDVTGPTKACADVTSLNYSATASGDTIGITYAWNFVTNTTNAVIVNPTLKNITVQPSSGSFTAGTFTLRLIVTNGHGLKDTAWLNSNTAPGNLVTITKINVNATATPDHIDLAISNTSQLNAVASGGTGAYTYSWSPATGLSSTTIANPVFTAPGAGNFQFIVTVNNTETGCTGKDTINILVAASQMPCDVSGPSPVCPGSSNVYNGPADPNGLIGSYKWVLKSTVGSTIPGATNQSSVTVKAGTKCGIDTLFVMLTSPSGLLHDTCHKVIVIEDVTAPSLSGVPANTTVACASNVPAPANVTASDNCGLVRLNFSQVKQDSTCVNKFAIVRTWKATDSCGNTISASQTITVNDNIKPVITANFEKDISVQCVSQIPAAPTPTANDNCSGNIQPVFSAIGSGSACDSTITRKWVFTDACGNKDSVSQVIHVKDNTKPVITANFEKDISVQCVSQIPAVPTPTANDNCSGNIQPVFSAIGSGKACDSTITRKWIFTDACGNKDSVSQVIRVKDNTAPGLSGSAPNGSYACAKDVPAKPTITATDNCDANPVMTYSQVTSDSTCVNHFTITRKWYATDKCGNVSPTLTQVIMVNDNTKPVIVFKPADATVACTVNPVFGTAVFSDNCGTLKIDSATWIEGASCPYKHIRRWTATDACGNVESTSQTITVNCCLIACTYTQGFYGNTGGNGCTPNGGSSTAKQKMTAAVDAQAGDSVYFGLKSTGKFFTLFLSDITSDNIFKLLPGGGTPAALKGYATYSKTGTWSNVPLETKQNQYGKIKNNLLSQTMVLFFNMQGSGGLPGMAIMSDSLFTSKQTSCGSGVAVAKVDTFTLPSNVVQYLQTNGTATVQGLYDLANRYLGGQTVSGISAADVNNAVDAINRGFDECALLAGWGKSSTVVNGITGRSATTVAGDNNITTTGNMQLSVFPNPYGSVVNFRFKTAVSGRVELAIYNIVGARLAVIDKGYMQAGTWQTIQYHVPAGTHPTLIYRLFTGSKVMSGKILPKHNK